MEIEINKIQTLEDRRTTIVVQGTTTLKKLRDKVITFYCFDNDMIKLINLPHDLLRACSLYSNKYL